MNDSARMASLSGAAWPLRNASDEDIPELEELIARSVLGLQAAYYTAAQMNAAIGKVFGVDRQLIRDGTYFVAEDSATAGSEPGVIVGCGGWSRRRTLYGSDGGRVGEDPPLDPAADAARIRAFFVHPEWARRGIARSILQRCESELQQAGFRRAEIVATLPGEPLYTAFGYTSDRPAALPLPDGGSIEGIHMSKRFS